MNYLTFPRSDRHTLGAPRFRLVDHKPLSRERRSTALPESGLRWAKAYCAKLQLTDLLIIAIAVGIAFFSRIGFSQPQSAADQSIAIRSGILSLLLIAAWSIGLSVFRTRDLRVVGSGAGEYKRVVNASTTVFGPVAIVFSIVQVETARWFFTMSLPVGIVGLLLTRWLWRRWLARQRTLGHFLSRVLVVGKRSDVESAIRQIEGNSGAAYQVVGVVLDVVLDGDETFDDEELHGIKALRDLDHVADHASALGANGVVIVGQPTGASEFIHDLAWQLEGKTIELILATSLANVAGPRIHFRPVDGLPLLHVEIPQFEGGKHILKRALDVVLSSFALVALSPLFLVLIILIKVDSDGKALFSQERVGRGGRTFQMMKFRSMVESAPDQLAELVAMNQGNGLLFKMKNDPRVTRIGKTLRRYSLDEFPQLWNVLMGDMSMVGPRPPLPCEVQEYEEHVRRRLYIKPGLTGMWQINGRSELSWEDSVRLDLYYVENWSLVGDLRIMWRTLRVLIRPVGAY